MSIFKLISFNLLIFLKIVFQKKTSKIILLTLFVTIVSFLDLVSIGLIIPFVTILIYPEKIFYNQYANTFIENLGLNQRLT